MSKRERLQREPNEIAASIAEKAEYVQNGASHLTDSVKEIEQHLGKMKGRVETEYHGEHPDAETPWIADQLKLALLFHRVGKAWQLSWSDYREDQAAQDPDYTADWKPLVEAPIKIKMAAVTMLPDLLEAMAISQDKLITSLCDTLELADKFLQKLVAKDQGAKQ